MTRLARGLAVLTIAGACGGEDVTARPPGAPGVPSRDATTKVLALGAPQLDVVLDDARFAEVRERLRAKDAAGASRAFLAARAAPVPGGAAADVGAARACALDYVEGRLHRDAGEDDAAARAFDRVPADCALASHAALYAAGAYARLGRADDAIDRAKRVAEDATVAADARLVMAEALAARGDRAAALAIWRAHLAASPHGARWVDTAVKIADALLDGVDGDPAAHAREAFDAATRVVLEAPKIADAAGAQAARDRAVALLKAADPKLDDAWSPADRARRAQAWLDANEPGKAIADATPILGLGASPVPTGTDVCHAAIVRAQATARTKGTPWATTADAYGDAIARCQAPGWTDDALVTALFAGAKASLSAKRTDEALDRFARVEALFPKHRLADDARLRRALVAQQAGDAPKAEALFASLADDYDGGDMRGEALFRLALARMERGEWEAAKGPLDRAAAIDADDRHQATMARAAYFRARAEAMHGDPEDAAKRYERVIADAPLGFYMAEAHARLAAIDPARARRAVEDAVARDAASGDAFVTGEHEALRSASFARGVALLGVGEIEDARRELARTLGDGNDAEVLWTVALLDERAGAPDVAEALVHSRLADYAGHWPAGRWRARWEIAFPRPFGDLVESASAASGIPSVLTWAIMREESSFFPEARSPSDAYGLMQIIVPTARGLVRGTPYGADPESLKRPEVSITLGAKLLGGLRASYPSNRALAIAAYNGGGGSVARWLAARPNMDFDLWVEEIPFDETRAYVKRVLANEAAYAFLYAPSALDEVLSLPATVKR
jgi:soluble lytic murein transglycosylase